MMGLARGHAALCPPYPLVIRDDADLDAMWTASTPIRSSMDWYRSLLIGRIPAFTGMLPMAYCQATGRKGPAPDECEFGE
jgi:hypothetical protein